MDSFIGLVAWSADHGFGWSVAFIVLCAVAALGIGWGVGELLSRSGR